MKHAFTLQSSITIHDIDICVNEIQKFLRSIVEIIVSWTIFNRHVKSFWNEQCNTTIKNTRKLRRLWSALRNSHDLTFYMKINDRKQKIIQKIKRANFRQKIEKIVETLTSLWRFVKWAKNKNHQSRKVLKMLIFRFNDLTIETFDEKAKMFKSVFFSTSSSIELDDILKSFYFRFIECFFNITKRKMLKIIKQIVFDKISSFDEIINNCSKFVLSSWCNCSLRYSSSAYNKRITQKRSKNQHHHVEKDRQERLHDFEDVSIDRVIEHHRKNSWVHHEQEDFMNNENTSIIVRHVHEMSKESIN
jgi:hypothetical protein